MGLAQFEKRLEQLVEGAFAKAFRSGIQPIEIGRRITREMDLRRQLVPHGLVAPNLFYIHLAASDFEKFASYEQVFQRELVQTVMEHAREEGYTFVGTVKIEMLADETLRPSRFEVISQVKANPDGLPGASLILPDGRRLNIGADPVVIGRLPECGVSLTDTNVSRRHAEIRRAGNDVMVVDLGSTNGTRVNGLLTNRQRLKHGDEITVGSTNIVFEAI